MLVLGRWCAVQNEPPAESAHSRNWPPAAHGFSGMPRRQGLDLISLGTVEVTTWARGAWCRPLTTTSENHYSPKQFIFDFSHARGRPGILLSLCRGRWRDSGGSVARFVGLVMSARLLVSVVDDDESVRESLPDLLGEFGFAAQAFKSSEAFLSSAYIDKTRCLILDIAMPGMTGPELQRELKTRELRIPIIFITAQRDEALRLRLLKAGAVACLFKPFSDTDLLQSLNAALRLN